MRICLLICIGLSALLTPPGFAENGDEKWDGIERARFNEDLDRYQRCSDLLRARVQAITPQADGSARVIFHADGRFKRVRQPLVAGPLRGFDRESIEKFSRDYALVWSESKRPMPWTPGEEVSLGVRGTDVIVVDLGEVKIMYCHKRSDGEVEVLALDGPSRWLLLHPNRLGDVHVGGIGLDWIRGTGIVMTNDSAGDAGDNLEAPGRRKAGLVPVNAPERIVQPGRDGWQDGDSFFNGKDNPKDPNVSDRLRNLIPPSQRIYCAG